MRMIATAGDFVEAEQQYRDLLKLTAQHGWRHTEAFAHVRFAWITMSLGRFEEAREALERGTPIAEEIGDRYVEVLAGIRLGVLLAYEGEIDRGRELLNKTMETAKAEGYEEMQADLHFQLARIALQRGDSDIALAETALAEEMYRLAGTRAGIAHCLNMQADVAMSQGALDEAEAAYSEMLTVSRAIGSHTAALAEANLAQVRVLRGKYAEALPALRACRDAFQTDGNERWTAWMQLCIAACAAASRDWKSYDAELEPAIAYHHKSGGKILDTAVMARRVGEIARDEGESLRAGRAFALAADQYRGLQRDAEAEEMDRELAALPDG